MASPMSTDDLFELCCLVRKQDEGDPIVGPGFDEGRLYQLMLTMDCVLDGCEEVLRQTS